MKWLPKGATSNFHPTPVWGNKLLIFLAAECVCVNLCLIHQPMFVWALSSHSGFSALQSWRTTADPDATAARKNSTVVIKPPADLPSRGFAHNLLGRHKYLWDTCQCSIVRLGNMSPYGEGTLAQTVRKSVAHFTENTLIILANISTHSLVTQHSHHHIIYLTWTFSSLSAGARFESKMREGQSLSINSSIKFYLQRAKPQPKVCWSISLRWDDNWSRYGEGVGRNLEPIQIHQGQISEMSHVCFFVLSFKYKIISKNCWKKNKRPCDPECFGTFSTSSLKHCQCVRWWASPQL